MSYRNNRRQSIYLQRNSITRTNSYDASQRKSLLDNGPIPTPDLKLMKVYKGYEFVTFKPVDIMPPSSSSSSLLSPLLIDEEDELIENQHRDSKIEDTVDGKCDEDLDKISTAEIMESRVPEMNSQWITNLISLDQIEESEARECLCHYVAQKFCYGAKAAREMSILDYHHSLMIRYRLESVCERRQLCWSFEPFVNPDSPRLYSGHQAPPDDPWKISVNQIKDLEDLVSQLSAPTTPQPQLQPHTPLPPIEETENGEEKDFFPEEPTSEESQRNTVQSTEQSTSGLDVIDQATRRDFQQKIFQDQCLEVTVPGTMSIHSCHVCAGVGRKRCAICVGSGATKCDMCDGVGYFGLDHHNKSVLSRTLTGDSSSGSDYCWKCRGRGRLRCDGCTGVGMTACIACSGSGQIKCFIKMIVTLTNHHNSVIIRDHYSKEIPFDQVKLADGHTVLDEDGINLGVATHLDNLLSKESFRLMKLHRKKYLHNSRLILQRHRIIAIPVVKVNSTWRSNRFRFYVFSCRPHRKCFTVDYPQRCCMICCCGCCCCRIN